MSRSRSLACQFLVAFAATTCAAHLQAGPNLPPHLPSWGGDTRAVDLADFDGDGDLDAFIGSAPGNYASILRNNGHGRFQMTDWIGPNTWSVPTDVVVADFDQDGDWDLLVAQAYDSGGDPTDMPNVTYLNNGDGTMADASYLMPAWGKTLSVDAGDVDGDLYPDVYQSNWGEDVFYSNSFPEPFESAYLIPAGISPGEEMEDFDGDGDVDIFVQSHVQGYLLINDGSGNFTDGSAGLPTLDDDERIYHFATGDVDGDEDLDMLVHLGDPAYNGNPGTLHLWINDGDGGFTDVPGAFSILPGSVLELFDADGDSDLDLFRVNGAGAVLVLNDGAGNFSEGGQIPPAPEQGVRDVASGDVDGDGDLDLLLGVYGYDRLWINSGSGSFVQAGDCPIVDMGSDEFSMTCPWDLDCNEDVGINDLLTLLADWANPYGITDFLDLLANWGPCS